MKRKDFLMLTTLTPVALAAGSRSDAAPAPQENLARPTRTKGTAADLRALDNAPVSQFDIASLSPAERQQADAIATASVALLVKGLLYRADARRYPITGDASTPEGRAAAIARDVPDRVFARWRPRLEKALADPVRRRKGLKGLSEIDFTKPSLQAELAPMAPHIKVLPHSDEPVVPRSGGSRYDYVHLILRALRCVDETNPESGDDDMVLGCLIVGASGHAKACKSVVCGSFDDGDVTRFGMYPLGIYNLHAKANYPKTFYGIFQLVESDSDDREVAQALTQALATIASIVVGIFATAAAGAAVASAVTAVGTFVGMFLDEDYFPPMAVQLVLNSENQLGADGTSGYLRTEDIRGHGGRYRIGYQWHLA